MSKEYYEKMYVRTHQDAPFSNNYPLAIMTHYENDSKFEGRKKTCDDWASPRRYDYENHVWLDQETPDVEKHLINNELVEGFKIDDYKSRSRTDNKVFEILDPRGFTLQIYTDNLMDIILNNTIVNGVIQGKFCWGRESSKNVLVSESEFDAIKASRNRTLEIGSAVRLKNNTRVYTYLGKCEFSHFDFHRDYSLNNNISEFKLDFFNQNTKAFLFLYRDSSGEICFHMTKSLVKHDILDDSERPVELSEILPNTQYHMYRDSRDMITFTDDKKYEIPYDIYLERMRKVNWGSAIYHLNYQNKTITINNGEFTDTT